MKLRIASLILLLSGMCFAQNTTSVKVNPGEVGWATFGFDGQVDSTGSTDLVVQCFNQFNRAELIVDFGVYGGQMSTDEFPVDCEQTGARAFVLADLPQTFNLMLYGQNGSQQPVTLVLYSVSWYSTGYKTTFKSFGSAQISY